MGWFANSSKKIQFCISMLSTRLIVAALSNFPPPRHRMYYRNMSLDIYEMSFWEHSALHQSENILEWFWRWKCHRFNRASLNKVHPTRDVREVFTDVLIERGSPIPLLKTVSRKNSKNSVTFTGKSKQSCLMQKMQSLNHVSQKKYKSYLVRYPLNKTIVCDARSWASIHHFFMLHITSRLEISARFHGV